MKNLVALLGLVALGGLAAAPARAQQQAQYSQYMNNNYILNPAVAGTEEYIDVKVSSRLQWAGLEGAPATYYASINSSLGKWRTQPGRTRRDRYRGFHALGALVYQDLTGPTSRTGVYGTYAYNLALSADLRLALGASVGMQQFAIDGQMLHFHDVNNHPGDQASRVPDAAVGLWLYSPDFYVGVSGAQLLGNELNFSYAQSGGGGNFLRRHYFATGGVRLPLSDDWTLVPSALVKFVQPAPASVDLNAKLRYRDLLWVGASWRAFDSVVAMVGFNANEFISVGYSYDTGISRLASYNYGSHEVILGLKLKKKPKVVCPDRFW